MKSLLFLTPELPYPAHSGGKLKSLKLLKHLTTKYQVTLACPLKEDDPKHLAKFMEEMNGNLEGCLTEPTCVARTPTNLAKSYVQQTPLNVLRTRSVQLDKKVNDLNTDFDIVFLDHYEVHQYIPEKHSGAVVYHGHNAYFKMWERYAKATESIAHKLVALAESYRVRNYEKLVCDRADIVFAAPDDLKALKELGVSDKKLHDTYHLGDDSTTGTSNLSWEKTDESLLYVGYLGWEANSSGLLWFIEHVWPKLEEQHPELKLNIAGKNPGPELASAVSIHANINLLGYVENLDNVYQKSRISIAPLNFGSGMKVKVLSAMARGIPVVTTPIGAESITAEHRKQLMIAASADEMIEQIKELLENKALWQGLSHQSKLLIESKYNWRSVFSTLDKALEHTHETFIKKTISRKGYA